MLMVDLVLNLDSVYLKDGETVEDIIAHIRERWSMGYEPTYEVLYEEIIDD